MALKLICSDHVNEKRLVLDIVDDTLNIGIVIEDFVNDGVYFYGFIRLK
jgi:hypothetical protein